MESVFYYENAKRTLKTKLRPYCRSQGVEKGESCSWVEIYQHAFGKNGDSIQDMLTFLRLDKGKSNPLRTWGIEKGYKGRRCFENQTFKFPLHIFQNESSEKAIKLVDMLIEEMLTYYRIHRYNI